MPVLSVAAQAQEYGPYNHPHAWGGGWGGMIFGPLMMIAFLAVVVVLVVLAIRWVSGAGHVAAAGAGRMSALDVLKDRFARGEIDKQEYEERRRVLSD
ncbi:SHOCT domain-containing protein [Pelagibius litoralis]|uniref:SHOCT domain-containing protein n=2 Tax=Pelagibius litoralis TaxID=374515 RepID=A0A967F1B2_9PROT|nr:SHOCT domain-containing protein [Pelagibius litoralis]